MNHAELDRLLAAVTPITDADVAALDLAGSEAELMEEIMATPTNINPSQDDVAVREPFTWRAGSEPWADEAIDESTVSFEDGSGEPGSRPSAPADGDRRRRRSYRLAIGGVAVAASIAVGALVSARSATDSETTEVPAIGPAASPGEDQAGHPGEEDHELRPLLDAPGWRVTSVYDDGPGSGSIEFRQGERVVGVSWSPAGQYDAFVEDRRTEYDSLPENPRSEHEATVLGRPAVLFEETLPSNETFFETFISPAGDYMRDVYGHGFETRQQYLEVLDSLRLVTEEEWREAIGDDVPEEMRG